jgi:hypothetical protein
VNKADSPHKKNLKKEKEKWKANKYESEFPEMLM